MIVVYYNSTPGGVILHIIAVSNQKGGVAKTTTASALAVGLASRGKRVLAVDLDAQANLSYCSGIDAEHTQYTILNLLRMDAGLTADQVIQHIDERCFDIIPSNISLSTLEQQITDMGKEYRLREVLEPLRSQYDYIIMDTPPQLGLINLMAISAATDIIVPSSPAIFDVRGMTQLYNTINSARKYYNPQLKIMGVLLTKCNTRTKVGKEIRRLLEEEVCPYMETTLFRSTIRNATAVIEAQTWQSDILTYAPNTPISDDYLAFVDEVIERS